MISAIKASGGGPMLQRVEKFLDGALSVPSISIVTPAEELKTYPVEPEFMREVVNEGPKPYTLHDAAHAYLLAD